MCAPAPNQRYLQHSFNSVELIPDRDDYGDGDGCGDSDCYEYYNDYFDSFGYYDGYDLQFVLACVCSGFNSYDRLRRVPLTLIIMTVLFARS